MKKFLLKIGLFVMCYLAISITISSVAPYHWGNPWFSSKVQLLNEQTPPPYNTYFFGSSRIYRQVSPTTFDSTFNATSSTEISSFNLGAPATFNPQCFYLYENFLNSPISENATYCFLELMEVDLLGDFFMHQERSTYWQNLSDYLFITKSLYVRQDLTPRNKIKSTIHYTSALLEKTLGLGHFGQQILDSNFYKKTYLGPEQNGYFPLELDLQTTIDPNIKEHLLERQNSFLENSDELQSRKKSILNQYNNISDSHDKINLERINELIRISKEKGIHLFFVLSPRRAAQDLINLSRLIPEANFIDMCDPSYYPELYKTEYSFDVGHLNTKGSQKYSVFLASEMLKKLAISRDE